LASVIVLGAYTEKKEDPTSFQGKMECTVRVHTTSSSEGRIFICIPFLGQNLFTELRQKYCNRDISVPSCRLLPATLPASG
jgi:hypothetical protein